jgi:hypothetical protein
MSTIPDIPVNHEQQANAHIATVRQLAQSIQGFSYAARGRRVKIGVTASVPDAFLLSTAAACDAAPEFSSAVQLTGSQLRQAIDYQRAYVQLADELELIAKGLRDTLAEHRFQIGTLALRAYSVAKSFARPTDSATFIPHLKNMKRDLRKSSPKTTSTPDPAPVPVIKK